MDVRLSPEQRALRDSATQIVGRLGAHAVGQLGDHTRAAKLDATVEAAGWRELRTSPGGGPAPASAVEAALVAEELGHGLADTSFLGPTLAAELRRRGGAGPADEPETVLLRVDLTSLAVAANRASTTAGVAIDAAGASRALLLVPATGGFGLACVDVTESGRGVDLTRRVAEVGPATAFQPVEQDRLLSGEDLAAGTALGLALTAADLVGVMRGSVTLACDYAKQRRQYGRPVGSFQAVQHLLADAFVAMEGSRSVALHAAWAVDALPPQDALASAALAKAYCSRAAATVCETGIQVHGGIGNTWDCMAHVYLRRALLSTDILGGAEVNLGRLLDHRGIGGHGLR